MDGSGYTIPAFQEAVFYPHELRLNVNWHLDSNEGWEDYHIEYNSLISNAIDEGDCFTYAALLEYGIAADIGLANRSVYTHSVKYLLEDAIENNNKALVRLYAGYGGIIMGDILSIIEEWDSEIFNQITMKITKEKYDDYETLVDLILQNIVESDQSDRYNRDFDENRDIYGWNRFFFAGWSKSEAFVSAMLEESYFGEAGIREYSIVILDGYEDDLDQRFIRIPIHSEWGENAGECWKPDTDALAEWLKANSNKWIPILEQYDIKYTSNFSVKTSETNLFLLDDEYSISMVAYSDYSYIGMRNITNSKSGTYDQKFDPGAKVIGWTGNDDSPGKSMLCFIEEISVEPLVEGEGYNLKITPYSDSANQSWLNDSSW